MARHWLSGFQHLQAVVGKLIGTGPIEFRFRRSDGSNWGRQAASLARTAYDFFGWSEFDQ